MTLFVLWAVIMYYVQSDARLLVSNQRQMEKMESCRKLYEAVRELRQVEGTHTIYREEQGRRIQINMKEGVILEAKMVSDKETVVVAK